MKISIHPLSTLLMLLFFVFGPTTMSRADESEADQFGAMLVKTSNGEETQLAVHWTGDASARLLAWIELEPGVEVQVLEDVLLDEAMKLLALEVPEGLEIDSSGVPMRFRLFGEGQGPRVWMDSVEWLGPPLREPDPVKAQEILGNCEWTDGFHGDTLTDRVYALEIFDDGTGPALYAGGAFRTWGSVVLNGIGKWDGVRWSPLGTGIDGLVRSLTVYDDGSGPVLVAGGSFMMAGGTSIRNLAQWDGASWQPLGTGPNSVVFALTTYDDGTGLKLIAGGAFVTIGGISANRVAQWDGNHWSALGSGVDDWVQALTVYDAGGGPVLFVGGRFTVAGGMPASRIAQWDGTSWSPLGSGVEGSPPGANLLVRALTVHDTGSGPVLVAGGEFVTAGGVTANNIAAWNGSNWSAFGSGASSGVLSLAVYDGGTGPALVAGPAGFGSGRQVVQWDGVSWTSLGSGIGGGVDAMVEWDAGSGPVLFAGGSFVSAGGLAARHIAKWDGTAWSRLSPMNSGKGYLEDLAALQVYDDGSGPVLVAAGGFTSAGGVPANRIAQWDGMGWTPLGSGLDGRVHDLAVHPGNMGPVLIAVGSFSTAGGTAAQNIARWDGASWSPLGAGVDDLATAVASYDDGSGPVVVVAGDFTEAGGVPVDQIAQWDGMSWLPLGMGLNGRTQDLAVHVQGTESVLVAGGLFTTAGGVPANYVALWNGTTWSALGAGMDGGVDTLVTYDPGTGPVLMAAGEFSTADGLPANRVAQWDGVSWSALGSGTDARTWASTVLDAGKGPVYVVGGALAMAGEVPVNGVALWDDMDWASVGTGVEGGSVQALTVFDDGSGPYLVLGGDFEVAGSRASSNIAMVSCTCGPNLDIPEEIAGFPFEMVTVPVVLTTHGNSLAATSFSVDFDETCLDFEPRDGDNDGVPDSVTYLGPAGYDFRVSFDEADTDGELDIALFDSTPGNPLIDGTLMSIDFQVGCDPAAGVRVAPVLFSADPSPTFGDPNAVDVLGTWSDGSVVIYGGLRGDCNSSGALGAADLTAGELEIFDDDGTFWTDVPGSTFAGLPVGCDSNADTIVDAGDLSCTYRLLFGLTCGSSDGGRGSAPPSLELGPWEVPLQGDKAVSRLTLRSAGWQANSLVVSLDLDTDRFVLDPTDGDGDGLPDAIRLPGFVPSRVEVFWDADDTDGELDLVLTHPDVDPTVAFPEVLEIDVEIEVPVGVGGYVLQPFRFSGDPSPSLGDVFGGSLALEVSIPETGLFADGFESGDLSAWSSSR